MYNANLIKYIISAQQYRPENTRNYQQIPRAIHAHVQRRKQAQAEYDRFNEERQIPVEPTNSERVNDYTDIYMASLQQRSPDEANRVNAATKNPRTMQQQRQHNTREEYCNQNQVTENFQERRAPRPFQPLAGQSLAYKEMPRSEAARQMAAGDAGNRKAENEQNGYQQYTASAAFKPKHNKSQPSFEMTTKETINMYGDEDTGEPITVLNVEEMANGFTDAKMLQTGQKKHSKIVEEAIQLEKTKSIVVDLIDNALDKLKSKRLEGRPSETSFTETDNSFTPSRMKQMKNSCFKKIEDELKLLKTLDRFSNDSE